MRVVVIVISVVVGISVVVSVVVVVVVIVISVVVSVVIVVLLRYYLCFPSIKLLSLLIFCRIRKGKYKFYLVVSCAK